MSHNDDLPSQFTRAVSNDWVNNPKYIELQEELRSGFSTITSAVTSLAGSPTAASSLSDSRLRTQTASQGYDFTRVAIPKSRLCMYLSHWITECAPLMDKFDEERHFGVHVPIVARNSPALFYALLAFSARHYERTCHSGGVDDSLELYQEAIRLLVPALQAGDDDTVLGAACILACLELMSNGSHDWRRHAQGCASLFLRFNIDGFSTGLQQAIFWCYARMDLCGAIMSYGANSTVLPINRWVPAPGFGVASQDDYIRTLFAHRGSESPGMYANWAVYLCAKTCDLLHRQTEYLEMSRPDDRDQEPFGKQWVSLWQDLQQWHLHRPSAMQPIYDCSPSGSECFPEVLFTHWAAISSTQLYHTACLILIDTRINANVPEFPASSGQPFTIARWHARRICGISMTNPHTASLINAIQPLYVAGRLMTHPKEHLAVANILKQIETRTGWSAVWRLADLEREWGYEPGEISS